MLCYLNRGLILEQAIVGELNRYFDAMQLDAIYRQHRVHVTLQHPFARLFRESNLRAADHFPSVIVSTVEESKEGELAALRPQTQGSELSLVGYTESDIDIMLDIYESELVNGKRVKKPGICALASDAVIAAIRERFEAEHEYVYGYSIRTYRRDRVSIEVWAENIQLKNELYEQVRLFVLGDMRRKLIARYQFYDIKLDDDTVSGQRSNAWNLDFDVPLAGAAIACEITYVVEQNVLNTEWEDNPREIIPEGTAHAR